MSIVLHIERLIIDESVLGGERTGRVRAELEQALAQQLSQPGAAQALAGIGAVTALPACGMSDASQARGGLGGRIAMAVEQGLGAGSGHGARHG